MQRRNSPPLEVLALQLPSSEPELVEMKTFLFDDRQPSPYDAHHPSLTSDSELLAQLIAQPCAS